MILLLVRHAESWNNAHLDNLRQIHGFDMDPELYNATKKADPELSKRGENQAARLAEHIQVYIDSLDFVKSPSPRIELIASPMKRALSTAKPIATQLRVRVEVWADVHETKGCWKSTGPPNRGSNPQQILAEHGDRYFMMSNVAPVSDAGWWTDSDGVPRGKETMAESLERARLVASRLRRRALLCRDQTITIMVTHGNWMSLLLQALMFPHARHQVHNLKHDNTAVTAIVLPGGGGRDNCQLVFSNRSEHLDVAPKIVRTRQRITFYGFNDLGVRPKHWVPPAVCVDGNSEDPEGRYGGALFAALAGAAAATGTLVLAWAAMRTRGAR